jgi:hypothetical protein
MSEITDILDTTDWENEFEELNQTLKLRALTTLLCSVEDMLPNQPAERILDR